MITATTARESLQSLIDGYLDGEPAARISIPADPERDDDLILAAFIDQAESDDARLLAFLAELARLPTVPCRHRDRDCECRDMLDREQVVEMIMRAKASIVPSRSRRRGIDTP